MSKRPVISQSLSDAIFAGDKELVIKLVNDGASVRAVNQDECDAGLIAAIAGNIEIYDYLSAHPKFKKTAVDKFGNDAAILAAAFGKIEMYDHLIAQHSFNVNAVNRFGKNALIMAVENGVDIDSIKHLIARHPINLNHRDKEGTSATGASLRLRRKDAEESINQQLQLNLKLERALDDIDSFKALCAQGAQPKVVIFEENDLANLAVYRNATDAYKLLVEEYGFEVREIDLLRAASRGHEGISKYIAEEHHQKFSALQLEKARAYSSGNEVISEALSSARKSRVRLDDIVECISPTEESEALWKESADPVIYYSFDTPSFNPGFNTLTDEEKDFFRKIIADSKDLIDVPIQEIRMKDEELGTQRLIAGSKNTILIGTSPKDFFITEKESGKVMSFNMHDGKGVAHKKVILHEDFLGEGKSRRYANYVILHEFFGHAIGNLKHPNKYNDNETGTFCKEDIFTEDTIMSYYDADKMSCDVIKKNSVNDCDQTWPQELRPADLIAINKKLRNTSGKSKNGGVQEELTRQINPFSDDSDQIFLDFKGNETTRQNPQTPVASTTPNDPLIYGAMSLAGVLAAKTIRRLVGNAANRTGPKGK
jgi:ankyrin repeat protein